MGQNGEDTGSTAPKGTNAQFKHKCAPSFKNLPTLCFPLIMTVPRQGKNKITFRDTNAYISKGK